MCETFTSLELCTTTYYKVEVITFWVMTPC